MKEGLIIFKSQREITAARRAELNKKHDLLLNKVDILVRKNNQLTEKSLKELLQFHDDSLVRIHRLLNDLKSVYYKDHL